eukprot:1358666-Amorphochlora_amoeboformis.AAC.1
MESTTKPTPPTSSNSNPSRNALHSSRNTPSPPKTSSLTINNPRLALKDPFSPLLSPRTPPVGCEAEGDELETEQCAWGFWLEASSDRRRSVQMILKLEFGGFLIVFTPVAAFGCKVGERVGWGVGPVRLLVCVC